MNIFVGTYKNKVDKKGRVSLPAVFRDQLNREKKIPSNSFYIFPSPVLNALEAGGEDLMKDIAKSIENQSEMFSEEEDVLSYVLSVSRLVNFDSTGRFILPSELMKFANINDEAVFVGRPRRFQIWNNENFDESSNRAKKIFKDKGFTLKIVS